MDHYVNYNVHGYGPYQTGPFPNRGMAEFHCRDIAGYEGVAGAYVVGKRDEKANFIPWSSIRD